MSILETEVWVGLAGKTVKHYEDKGYEIPRRINKYGKLAFENGTKILVRVEDLKEGAIVKVTKVCDEDDCGNHIPNQKYSDILKSRENGDGKDRCLSCSYVKGGKTQKENMKYENSLEYWAKENGKHYLLDEFSYKNIKLPSQVSYGTTDKYWWNCPDCKSEYDMSVTSRTSNGRNCSYCSGTRVNHTNCLWTTHPEIARLLNDERRGYEITAGTHKKEEFTCPDCMYSDKKAVSSVVSNDFSCNRCGDGISYPEKFMMSILSQLNIDFETQKTFNWSKNVECENTKLSGNKIYDFYLPFLGNNCIIETHGEQHSGRGFESIGGRSLEEEIENDRLKEKLANENGIENYIAIDCRKSEMDFIKNNILNSELNNLLDLSNIDWIKCNEFACNSLVKLASNYWNSGIKSTTQIGELMNLNVSTIIRYLKRAVELSWVNDYDSKNRWTQGVKVAGDKNKKKIVQLSLYGEFIREWESASDASVELNIGRINISSVCRGKQKTTGSFRWAFKEDYEKQLLQSN